MAKNKHIIEKIFLEVNTNSMDAANYLKNNSNMFIQKYVIDILEKELEALNNNQNEFLQINKLDISIENQSFIKNGIFNYEDIRQAIKIQLDQKIQKVIEETKHINLDTTNTTFQDNLRLDNEQRQSNTLIYYLVNGELPWWIKNNSDSFSKLQDFFKVENIYNKNQEYFSSSLKNIISEKYVQKRLINQFSNQQIALIVSVLIPKKGDYKKEEIQNNRLVNLLNQNNHFQLKRLFWETIFNFITNKNHHSIIQFYDENEIFKTAKIDFNTFISVLKDFVFLEDEEQKLKLIYQKKVALNQKNNQNNLKESKGNKESKSNHIIKDNNKTIDQNILSDSEQENDFQDNFSADSSFYIQNAGLILIHPFIKDFFKNCDLLNKDNSIKNKELAVHLLHYLATKEEYDYEYNMLFEKFLCDLPLHFPIKREIDIPNTYKIEAENLLQSVVSHWSALKNTSTDIVRTEFLKREGKLDLKQNNPKLYVQRKTQDILLDSIPWNIGIVKIPWFKKIIYTEW